MGSKCLLSLFTFPKAGPRVSMSRYMTETYVFVLWHNAAKHCQHMNIYIYTSAFWNRKLVQHFQT